MTKIFIEAKSNKTSEYHFLQAIISKFFPAIEVEFIFMDGIGNLYNEMHEKGFPSICIGSRLVVPKEHFKNWVDEQIGKKNRK